MEYVIGVDIGATKSHLALFDAAGTLVDFGHWGPLNHETLPGLFAQFEDELEQFVTRILVKNNLKIENVTAAAFGIGGVDTKKQYEITSRIIKKIGFKNFTLMNDAFLGIAAGNPEGVGICAINGSGCTLAGINKEGRSLQIGGVGFVSADYGGGSMLGEKAVSVVYSELFKMGEPTRLTKTLFEMLGISDKYDFVDKIYEKIEDGSLNVASLAKTLFEAAGKNDHVAREILRDVAAGYANGISCMIKELEFNQKNEDINIVFAGSVFVKSENPLLLDMIREKLYKDNPGCVFKYTLLNVPPVAGAALLAFKNIKREFLSEYYEKVSVQLEALAL